MSTRANSSTDYVVELLSEHGKRRALIGTSSNADAIYECYDYALRAYPHTTVRMRQGQQTIALRIPEAFVHEPHIERGVLLAMPGF